MSFNLFYGHHNGQNKICHFKPVIESNIKRSYSPKTFMFLDSVAFNDVSSEQTFVTSNGVSTDACVAQKMTRRNPHKRYLSVVVSNTLNNIRPLLKKIFSF